MRIKIELENEFGSVFSLENTCDPDEYFGEMDIVFDALHCLLRQAGYMAYNKGCLLQESLTEKEREELLGYLGELRNGK